jgi:hypothetical protein
MMVQRRIIRAAREGYIEKQEGKKIKCIKEKEGVL